MTHVDFERRSGPRRPYRRRIETYSRNDARESGELKWFDRAKSYGFITSDTGPDVFLHAKTVRLYGVSEDMLAENPGLRVRFKSIEGKIRPEAIALFVD